MNTLNQFIDGYIECALWSSPVDDGEVNLDEIDAEISEEARREMSEDCEDFLRTNASLLEEYFKKGYSAYYAGHDFWLTRNGHGAGFWDRGLGDLGEELTAMSKPYGECFLYLGDDGLIYLS